MPYRAPTGETRFVLGADRLAATDRFAALCAAACTGAGAAHAAGPAP